MTLPVAGRSRRALGLGGRLAVLSLLALLLTLATGGAALLAVRQVRLAQVIDTRTDQSATQALELDELNESLRADILGAYAGLHPTGADRSDAEDDLERLEVLAVALRSSADPGVAALGKDEYGYALRARTLLSMPTGQIRPATVSAFEDSSEALTQRVDTYRDTLSARQSESSRQADESMRAATIRLVQLAFAAAATLFVVGWVIRRRLLASLQALTSVARRVAEGNLDARTGSRQSDEVGELARAFDEMAATMQKAFQELDAEALRQDFRTRLYRAMAYVDDDEALAGTVTRALAAVGEDLSIELLVSDSSEAHLQSFAHNQAAEAPGCSVGSPWSCPAIRGGRMTMFASSSQIDACPHLRGRVEGERAAACAPVGFMGRTIGVLHVATAPGGLPDAEGLTRLETVAEQVGARMGALRALQKVQLQASLDGLTGLPNRRSFEDAVQELVAHGRPYGVLMADLDRFKTVNDTFGHAAGDRALRVFAEVLRTGLRTDDLPCRYGGEEFAIVLPGMDVEESAIVADRLRDLLAGVLAKGDTPVFTVSLGAADSRMGATLADHLVIADEALLAAKRNGRDRCVIGSPAGGGLPRPRPRELVADPLPQ